MNLLNNLMAEISTTIKKEMEQDTSEAFSTKSWGKKKWKKSPNSLIKSGKMKNSIKFSSSKKGVNVTAVEYAKYHNEGTDTIKQRKFIGLEKDSEIKLKRKIDNIIQKRMGSILSKLLK